MKLVSLGTALLALSGCAPAADVTAYVVSDGPAASWCAQRLASSILHKAGVTLEWRRQPPADLRIELAAQTPEHAHPGALAVSYPYAGRSKSVTVFLDRIRALTHGADRESALLAYVFAHEIVHIIQGVDRHSETGVMKVRWTAEDRAAIFTLRLAFAEEDLAILQRGLTAWRRDSASTRLSE